jgi:hypothetical protein
MHGRDRIAGMSTVPTKLVLEATYEELRTRADALKAAFTEPSMVAFVNEATEDLDDAGELLRGPSDAQPVLMTADFYLQYAASSIKQLEGVLRKFGSGVTTIR